MILLNQQCLIFFLNDIPSFYTELHHTLSNRIKYVWLFIAIAQQIAIMLHVIIITQRGRRWLANFENTILITNWELYNNYYIDALVE